MNRRSILIAMFLGLLAGVSIVFGAVFVIPAAARLEQKVFPPQSEWTPTSLKVDGDDVVLSGTVIKGRDCTYRPPPRARDEAGQNYLVDNSRSPTRTSTWIASPHPQRFGPWRVIGGAGKTLYFYQEFRCHGMWMTMVELGSVTTTKER